MSSEIISRCGCRCDLCPAYKENIKENDNAKVISDGWKKYFDFKIDCKDIYCDGCLNGDCVDARLLETKCAIRECVKDRGYENCSQCDDFMCDKFKKRLIDYKDFKFKYGKISKSDYKFFIKPYENGKLIKKLREKNGDNPRMLNKLIVPTIDDMEKFIGNECSSAWDEMYSFIHENYKTIEKIFFYSKNYGWALQFKQNKSSTLFTFFPERKSFMALIVYNMKDLQNIEQNKQKLSLKAYNVVCSSQLFPEGKWVSFRISKNEDMKDLITLLSFKKMPSIK